MLAIESKRTTVEYKVVTKLTTQKGNPSNWQFASLISFPFLCPAPTTSPSLIWERCSHTIGTNTVGAVIPYQPGFHCGSGSPTQTRFPLWEQCSHFLTNQALQKGSAPTPFLVAPNYHEAWRKQVHAPACFGLDPFTNCPHQIALLWLVLV